MKKVKLLSVMALSALLWNCQTEDIQSTAYQLDDTKSVAEWKGHAKAGFFNEGSIVVKSDQLIVEAGKVTGGSFTIPVSSIVNFNQPADSLKKMLVHHLQSADFFNMALHPNISYKIMQVVPYSGTEGMAGSNYQVKGNLTMLGKTNEVNFPAKIQLNNNQLNVEATLKVDRTKWGINYAADPTLPAESYILPDIDIHLKLSGSAK